MEVAEKSNKLENPVGLYKSEESGQYIGAVDPIQADAFVTVGFTLVKEGLEAAKMTAKEIDDLTPKRKDA